MSARPAMDLLYDALRMRSDKQLELARLEERRRTLNAELSQVTETIELTERQIALHGSEASRYMREVVSVGK